MKDPLVYLNNFAVSNWVSRFFSEIRLVDRKLCDGLRVLLLDYLGSDMYLTVGDGLALKLLPLFLRRSIASRLLLRLGSIKFKAG